MMISPLREAAGRLPMAGVAKPTQATLKKEKHHDKPEPKHQWQQQ